MARKKSAAKKAREALKRQELEQGKQEPKKQEPPNDDAEVSESNIDENESGSDSDSEIEDDFGELITEDIDKGINEVITAIRNNETDKLLDPKVNFFKEDDNSHKIEKNEKPIYLKDYHRMNILSGDALKDDEELDREDFQKTVDGEKSYVSTQREERLNLINEINNAFETDDKGKRDESNHSENDDDDDDEFLVKKDKKDNDHESITVKPTLNPENDEEFLNEFMKHKAWIPHEGDKEINLDINNDDEEFDNAVEDFENAYNFRFEDPNANEIVSYARNQATLRRSATTSRRKKRDELKQEKEMAKKDKDQAIQKKKIKKVNKLTDLIENLKKEFGIENISQEFINKITNNLMKNDYNEDDWDKIIAELFNDEFYNNSTTMDNQGIDYEDGEMVKPTWDDDIMYDGEEEEEEEEEKEEEREVHNKKQSKKEKKESKQKVKKEKKKLHDLIENAVEENKLAIIEEVEEEKRGRSRSKDSNGNELNEDGTVKFRYREVSPESYGLSVRDIFAADDADLNEFISLKKFAPYRAAELRHKDKRKVTKARRIREWRKKTFHDENGPVLGKIDDDTHDNSKDSHHKRHRHDKHKEGKVKKHKHKHNQTPSENSTK